MSRGRPSDTFTRFTANSPHASEKPTTSSPSSSSGSTSQPKFSSSLPPGPDGETPAEKVARLRMQARAQKMNTQLSPVDRMLVTGRRWADNMHRVTTYGLLGLAGVSAVVAGYSLVSLVGHNRRQRRAWLDRELDRLQEAQRAFLRGDADAEQLHLLELERAGEEMVLQKDQEKKKRKSESTWTRVKGWVGVGAAEGEMGEETPEEARVRELRSRGGRGIGLEQASVDGEVKPVVELRPVAVQPSGIQGVGLDAKGRPVPMSKMERVVKVPDEKMAVSDEAPRVSRTGPGSLDAMAGNIGSSTSGSSWLSWLRGSN